MGVEQARNPRIDFFAEFCGALGDFQPVRRPVDYGEMCKAEQFPPAVPGIEFGKGITADKPNQTGCLTVHRAQFHQCIDRVSRALSAYFAFIDHHVCIGLKSELQHVDAMFARCERQPALLVWIAGGQQLQLLQFQLRKRGARKSKMAVVHRVERAAEKSDGIQMSELLADLSTAEHNPFLRRETFKSARATRVEFVGRDADFGTQTVLKAIGEAGRGIHDD